MAFRSFWQSVRNAVYDFVNAAFYDQEEIDLTIEDELSEWGEVKYDLGDIPTQARPRPNFFLSPNDAIAWIDRAGIPREYVYIYAQEDGWLDDTIYHVFVMDGS